MKKIFTLFAAALIASSAFAQTAKISADDVVVYADDESVTYLVVNLENDYEVCAWQLDVTTPEGVQVDGGELTDRCNQSRGKYTGTLGTQLYNGETSKYLVTFYEGTNSSTKKMYSLSGTEGPVAKIALYTNSSFPEGSEGTIKLSGGKWAMGDGKTSYDSEDIEVKIKSVSQEEYVAIHGINVDELQSKEIYNLSGQRVSTPTRGIYIINGKKVFVK